VNGSSGDRFAAAAFVIAFGFMCLLYGTVSSWWQWFPAKQIGLAYDTLLNVRKNWKNDLALEPTRHLVAPDDTGNPAEPNRGYVRYSDAPAEPGYVLIAGLNENQKESAQVVRLFDRDGAEVHRWPVRYQLFDEKIKPQNVMLHGLEVFPDGSLAVAFDSGMAIARIDACGQPLWTVEGAFHHSIMRDENGALMTWLDEAIVRLDENTGELLSSLDLRTDIISALNGEQQGYFNIRTQTPYEGEQEMEYLEDPFHPNDAEPLSAEMASAFPMFEAGDVLFSLRELNLIAVVDPDTGLLKWWRHGPWIKQHDPDFQPDGTITVFDNGTGTGRSLIRRIDPATDALSVVFAGSQKAPFYTMRRGKHQFLPNGNVLLTEAEHGRVLEVDPEGRVVWDRHMPWDATHNLIITEARYVPETFFAQGVPQCHQPEELATAM
jgi:hypothetical protein